MVDVHRRIARQTPHGVGTAPAQPGRRRQMARPGHDRERAAQRFLTPRLCLEAEGDQRADPRADLHRRQHLGGSACAIATSTEAASASIIAIGPSPN
jgi:hypothetical protein